MKKAAAAKTKLGQATSLPGPLWNAYRKHVLAHSSWLYVLVTLTHALCLKVTETLKLRRSDFDFKKKHVTIQMLLNSCSNSTAPLR